MKKTDRYIYPAIFTYEPGKEIAIDFPDLKCATSGTSDEDAFLSARELLGCVLNGLEEDGEEIPAYPPARNQGQGKRACSSGRCLYAIGPAGKREPRGQ